MPLFCLFVEPWIISACICQSQPSAWEGQQWAFLIKQGTWTQAWSLQLGRLLSLEPGPLPQASSTPWKLQEQWQQTRDKATERPMSTWRLADSLPLAPFWKPIANPHYLESSVSETCFRHWKGGNQCFPIKGFSFFPIATEAMLLLSLLAVSELVLSTALAGSRWLRVQWGIPWHEFLHPSIHHLSCAQNCGLL